MTASFEERFNAFSKAKTPEQKQITQISEQKPQEKQASFEERFKSFAQTSEQKPQENKPIEEEKSYLQKGLGIAKQFGLGMLEAAIFPYEVIAGVVSQPKVQEFMYRQNLLDSIDRFQDAKEIGGFLGREEPWNEEDEKTLESLYEQVRNPEKAKEFIKDTDISIRGAIEKSTGMNLHPEGALEKAANWLGFLKNPKELLKLGTNPKDIMKAVMPGKDIARSVGAGTTLQIAEEGEYGPLGTLGAAIIGDLGGGGVPGILKGLSQPKKSLASLTNLVTGGNTKKTWTKQIIQDAEKSGVQLDAGTLTNSNLIRMVQARAAQSGLSGQALDNFRKDLSQQIVGKYGDVADKFGSLSFENNYQASQAIKDFVKNEEKGLFQKFERNTKTEGRSLQGRIATQQADKYEQRLLDRISPKEVENSSVAGKTLKTVAEEIKSPIKEEFKKRWENFNEEIKQVPSGPQPILARSMEQFVRNNEGSLLLGVSSAEHKVVQAAQDLRDSLMTKDGSLHGVSLQNLIKTKRTLADVADYEFGGSNFKSSYKKLVSDIDHAVEETLGQVNPELSQQYKQLNAEYSKFKDTFENDNVRLLFERKNNDYNSIYNGFTTNPDKLRSLEEMMINNSKGKELVNEIKRDYAKRVVEKSNLSERDLRNLANVLGPEMESLIEDFSKARQQALESTKPRAKIGKSLGTQVELPKTQGGKPITKAKQATEHVQKKLYEYIKDKDPERIMKMMDTVQDIRKLKNALSLTKDGKELFKKLTRYKLFEMIDKNMMDGIKENVKLGTFSNLFKSSKSKAIVKELVGPEAFEQIQLLQKNAGRLAASADKFYNASKSGTTIADVAIVGSLMTGIFTGNAFMALSAASTIGGIKIAGHLLTDKKFLQYLKEAVMIDNQKNFQNLLKKMKSHVEEASAKAFLDSQRTEILSEQEHISQDKDLKRLHKA